MTEPMTTRVEVWPVAADTAGIWLLSGDDAWRPRLPVAADSEPHAEVEPLLATHDAAEGVALIHSTSWRVDGPTVVLTYIAVVRTRGLVLDEWPHALPVSLDLLDAVGRPPTHGPTEVPDWPPHGVKVTFVDGTAVWLACSRTSAPGENRDAMPDRFREEDLHVSGVRG